MFPWTDPPTPLRFDQFMAAALHDPGQGYYARRIRDVGRSGDFTTTPSLSPALGKAVTAWALRALRESRCRHLIELGPGRGTLAAAVLDRLPWPRRLGIRLHLVESSAPLRRRQEALLGSRVCWHATAAAALNACGGEACIYSNEFVDAFPVRRFRFKNRNWQELHLLPAADIWQSATDPPRSSAFDTRWPDGQIIEVHQSHHLWLLEALPRWKRGRMLTIDYGAEVETLYHRQPLGTFRGYFHHTRLDGAEALSHPGRHDLTADVNFTDLREIPGLQTRRLIDQQEFLLPHADPSDPADHYACDPAGPGAAFLVLDQERFLSNP